MIDLVQFHRLFLMFDEKLQTLLEAHEQLATIQTAAQSTTSQNGINEDKTPKTPKIRKRLKFADDTVEHGDDSLQPPQKRANDSHLLPIVKLIRIDPRKIQHLKCHFFRKIFINTP